MILSKCVDVELNLPEIETPVLVCVHGIYHPVVLEIRVDRSNPMVEGYYEDFKYWDDPVNDGQDYGDRVYCWQSLPPMNVVD